MENLGWQRVQPYTAVKILLTFLLMASLCCRIVGATALPLQNGHFDQGFTGWSGAIDDGIASQVVDPATHPLFQLVSGQAQLSTAEPFFLVTLLQQFTLPTTANTLLLSFAYTWFPTDGTLDALAATLDNGQGLLVDLFAGLTYTEIAAGSSASVNVTALAGQTVTLAFTLNDAGLPITVPDRLLVDTITVTEEIATAIPEPGTVLLLATGLLWGLGCRLRRGGRPS